MTYFRFNFNLINMFIKNRYKIIWFIFFLFKFTACEDCDPKASNQESQLKNAILCGYDTLSRPRKSSQDGVNVTLRMVVKNFNFADTAQTGKSAEASLTIGVWVVVVWTDEFLKWEPKDYGNHDEMVLNAHNIWIPDLSLYNSVGGTNYENVGFNIPCLVKYNGVVTCIPHLVYEAPCQPNYKKWPMDKQNCSMTFGTWMHKGEEVRFKANKNRSISVAAANKNSYWNIAQSGVTSHSGAYDCCPNTTYPTVTFWMMLERKSAAGVMFLVTPAVVMVLLTVVSLLLDINSLERISLMIINLYYHLFFMKYLSENVPISGDFTPNVVIYFRDSTFLACCVLIEGTLLRSILRRTDVVPLWVSNITNLTNSGAGKIIMFHEFDPAATAIISGDPETLNKEETELISKRDWLRFALLINRIFLIVVFITYVGLFLALMLF